MRDGVSAGEVSAADAPRALVPRRPAALSAAPASAGAALTVSPDAREDAGGTDAVLEAVVTTKLRPPPGRAGPVARPRLMARLEPAPGRRVTLLSAPAGFGKTTVLAEWLARRSPAGPAGAGPAVAWVTLDAGDDDPARFVTYLVAALRSAVPGSASGVLAALRSPHPPVEALAGAVVNAIAATPVELDLVLDDYHVVESAPVHQLVAYLVDRLPPQARVLIAGRVEPPLPLARWRARGQLAELHAAELAFTAEEADAFLGGVMGLDLDPEAVAALTARTEGWIAGLQLAALSVQGRAGPERAGFLRDFSGSQRDVLDFLAEEVLSRQPEPVQAFLLETSILDDLCGPLCDALTGRADGQATLEALERANLFVVALDGERRWYRYHRLFADFLRGQLERQRPARLPELHRRAAAWYATYACRTAAVGHALAAGDHDGTAALLEAEADVLWARGQVATLLGWLEALPEDVRRRRPRLLLERAAGRLWTGQPQDVAPAVAAAERAAAAMEDGARLSLLGYAAAVSAWDANLGGDPVRAATLARRALVLLPPEDPRPRLFATQALAVAHENAGDLTAAGEAFSGAAELGRAAGHEHLARGSVVQYARLLMARGRLRAAEGLLRQALLPPEAPPDPEAEDAPDPAAGEVRLAMGRLLYERDDLDGAAGWLLDGTRLAEAAGRLHSVVDGDLARSRLRWAQGAAEDALALAWTAERLARRAGAALSAVAAAAWTSRLQLALDDPAAARRDFERATAGGVPRAAAETAALATVRLLLAEGQAPAALEALDALRADPLVPAGAGRDEGIERLVLRALALRDAGRHRAAVGTLARALELAEPEGHVRAFVDEGPALAGLLRAVLDARQSGSPDVPRTVSAPYLRKLLAALEHHPQTRPAAPAAAPEPAGVAPALEPLTEREREVLVLIAAGKSNRQIAAELVVTEGTVKTHLTHVYRKLDAHSRTQALVRGRELQLI